MRKGIDHETFVIQGIVDGAVAMAQAEYRRDKRGETTHVHFHKENEHCNMKCKIVQKEMS